jgi:ribosomal protein S18 acetylase RimI-like enzyme
MHLEEYPVTTTRRWWAFERGTLWSIDAAEAARSLAPRTAVVFRAAGTDAAEPLAAAMGLPSAADATRRFTGRRCCYAAWDGERIAAYGWASRGYECVGELERAFHMAPDEAYIWDCVTLPEYRGRGLYSALLAYMLAELRDTGARRTWIGASLDNQPSIKGFINAGFRPAIKLIYGRLLALHCAWVIAYPHAPGELVAAAQRMIIAEDERMIGPLMVGFR